MSHVAVVPDWVTLPAGQVGGCHHFAARYAERDRFARACAATFEWVTAGSDPNLVTPVSGRWLEPTAQAARAEMMLAAAVASGQLGLTDDVWASLQVEPAVPVLFGRDRVSAVAATLGWLLGVHRRPPLRVR